MILGGVALTQTPLLKLKKVKLPPYITHLRIEPYFQRDVESIPRSLANVTVPGGYQYISKFFS